MDGVEFNNTGLQSQQYKVIAKEVQKDTCLNNYDTHSFGKPKYIQQQKDEIPFRIHKRHHLILIHGSIPAFKQ
jgi:hypothetical protein